ATGPRQPPRTVTIVADTSVLVDYLRGHEPARAAVTDALRSNRVVVSLVSKIEVLAGMRPDEETRTYRLFGQLEWADVDDDVAERAGRLAAAFARTHKGVELADFVVAATADLLDATLWTRNRRHFPMFVDLPDPYGD
ncbi:MAG: type II toxin-antitoxin system VapC family toxin, partial [Actinobacteria bacterium]|nr:type II toxin-antitoxin system VapC family toxin [Actinomycetota bacterium]